MPSICVYSVDRNFDFSIFLCVAYESRETLRIIFRARWSNWRERKKKGKGTGFVGNFDGFIGSIRSRVSLYVDFPFEHNSRPIDRIRVSKRILIEREYDTIFLSSFTFGVPLIRREKQRQRLRKIVKMRKNCCGNSGPSSVGENSAGVGEARRERDVTVRGRRRRSP